MDKFKVGYQKDITKRNCPVKSVSLIEVLRFMESDEKLKQLTERIRQQEDPDERKQLKNGLPGIIVSADTTCRKKSDDDIRNPLIFIDLDLKDHPDIDLEKVVDSMSYPWLIGYKKSASGGLHVLCGIEANVETHKRSFHALEEVFASHGLTADPNCKDEKRISYIAHDPDIERTLIEPLETWDGASFTPPASFEYQEASYAPPLTTGADVAPKGSLEDATEALRAIKDAIGTPKYEQRLYIHSGMYNSYGQAGYDAVQDVFGKKKFDKPIKDLTDQHTAGTVFHMAKELRKREETTAADFDDLEPMYHHRGKYYILDSTGARYIDIRDGDLTRQLRARGYSAKGIDGEMSAIDKIKADIVSNHTVDAVGALAGRAIGLHQDKTTGTRHLVTRKNRRIVAKAGDCSAICGILEAQYGYQVKYIYSWLKRARYQLEKEQYMQGHVLTIAGEVGGGKSLVAEEIIQPMLGAIANAIRYLAKGNDFNADLVGSEMLLLDDPPLSKLMVDRKRFGANLKAVCAGSKSVSCHGKGVDAYNVSPLWRIVVLLNDDDDALGAFPPLGEGDSDSVGDKVLLLRCEKERLPFAGDRDQFAKIGKLIGSQLEAFAHFVDSYQIPEEIKTGDCRFGFDEYHNPSLIQTVNQNSNERTLLSVTDSCLFGQDNMGVELHLCKNTTIPHQRQYWEGTAKQWAEILLKDTYNPAFQVVKSSLAFGNGAEAAGKHLARVAGVADGRITRRRTNTGSVWKIYDPNKPTGVDEENPF